jgi:hypothetical protein
MLQMHTNGDFMLQIQYYFYKGEKYPSEISASFALDIYYIMPILTL